MTSSEIRNSFLQFFEERGHRIVPSASVIPYDDPTLLFTNAGMNQFKDVFLGTGKREYNRAADTQKCIRVSGKHNDLEEVGRDTYHHTFFEMLGNWSFGDYYKKEAIEWAWDLLTKVWKLDKKRLYATVFESDDESEELWKKVTDINPSHVLRFGKKDNFWEMGETGPCGPCSEIHIDLTDDLSGGKLVNAGDPRVMEIWNLVFIQYNRDEQKTLTPLPSKHVDTGMGFERICAVLQGKKSNYDTDVFMPIINHIAKLADKEYIDDDEWRKKSGLTKLVHPVTEEMRTAIRVIADHIRMLTFSIADGGIPSNEGRGYVMRRILRRGARFGRTLGFHEPFMYKVVEAVVKSMGEQFPGIKAKQNHIERVIKGEEESFNQTLDRGLEIFEQIVTDLIVSYLKNCSCKKYFIINARGDVVFDPPGSDKNSEPIEINGNIKERLGIELTISGEDAFKLYDTFGFPLDLTELMATERGLKVDVGRFTELMEEQRERSQVNSKSKFSAGPVIVYEESEKDQALGGYVESVQKLDFNYEAFQVETRIKYGDLLYQLDDRYKRGIILEQTTFYAESGGQVSDTGFLRFNLSDEIHEDFQVLDVKKQNNRTVHVIEFSIDFISLRNEYQTIRTNIDIPRRLNIMRNHTATHLVHEALRITLGEHLHQQGSLVAPDKLRFDFNHFEKITPDQIRKIEDIVNEKIVEDLRVFAENDPNNWLTIEEAKKKYPNVKMFFGEKYGDKVRVVEVKDFCAELCGGTHVKNTKDIQLFKIISEASIASGIRRIEAVTGEGLGQHIQNLIAKTSDMDAQIEKLLIEKDKLEKQLGQFTKVENSTRPSLGKISLSETITPKIVDEVEQAIQKRESAIEMVSKSTNDLKKELSKYRVKEVSSGIETLVANAQIVDGMKVVSGKVDVQSVEELQSLGDTLRSKLGSGVGVLGAVMNEKISLVCVVTDDIIKNKKLQAGKIVGEIAKLVGGGGGGRPHLATAGGKDIGKLDDALGQTEFIVRKMLG